MNSRAPWARAWPRSPSRLQSAARERCRPTARSLTIWLWVAVALSLLALDAGRLSLADLRARRRCRLLAPLNGLVRGRRHTYAWATLFAIPYLAFALTELLVNPAARWVAAMSLLLVFALVLHYDFVPACFSSASRMNGMVSRR